MFPEIMPDRIDLPFFVSVLPFRRPRSQTEWLSSVLRKRASSRAKGRGPPVEELWDELSHDYDVGRIAERISDYEKRLKMIVG